MIKFFKKEENEEKSMADFSNRTQNSHVNPQKSSASYDEIEVLGYCKSFDYQCGLNIFWDYILQKTTSCTKLYCLLLNIDPLFSNSLNYFNTNEKKGEVRNEKDKSGKESSRRLSDRSS